MIYGRTIAIFLESYLSLGTSAKIGLSAMHVIQWQTLQQAKGYGIHVQMSVKIASN